MSLRALVVLLALTLGACASGPPRTGGRVTLLPDAADAPDAPYTLRRATVDAALDRGPSWLIQQVPVEPVLVDGQFYGFRIRALFPDDPSFREAAIRPGDIVQRVNDVSVATPDGFMKAWATLKDARFLSVRIVRAGQPLLVTWAIVDGAPRAATSAGP